MSTQTKAKCRVCGCTEDHACPGGCSWVEPDLCSRCLINQAEKEIMLIGSRRMSLSFSGVQAFQTLSALQLALRHPGMPVNIQKLIVEQIGPILQQFVSVGPATAKLARLGWHPEADEPVEAEPEPERRIILPGE